MNANIKKNALVVIGGGHGFWGIKAAHRRFKTGVTACDKDPTAFLFPYSFPA